MNLIQGTILGIIQGLTEFIPVSSSGHLVLVPWALNWPAPSLLFAMVHWGTLLAVDLLLARLAGCHPRVLLQSDHARSVERRTGWAAGCA